MKADKLVTFLQSRHPEIIHEDASLVLGALFKDQFPEAIFKNRSIATL